MSDGPNNYITQKKTAEMLDLTEETLINRIGNESLPRVYMEKKFKYKISDITKFRNSSEYGILKGRPPIFEGS